MTVAANAAPQPETTDATLPTGALSNRDIAVRFQRIADALEVMGENPFKIKAYRRAVETILDLEDSLADIDARGALSEIEGFGQAIIGKTRDFLSIGSTRLYDEVIEKVPLGVIDTAAIGGIGPKTTKALWEALGVRSVEELETAAREEKVRAVPGFGAAKEAKIIEAIERWRRLNERTPRYIAMPIAERYRREIAALPGVRQVLIARELRRGCDQVESIALFVAADDPKTVQEAVARLGFAEAHAEGHNPWTVRAKDTQGIVVEIFVDDVTDFGCSMIIWTGPAAFEYALDERTTEYSRPTEEEIFRSANLPYIAPELRDWPDIIERAERGELPQLITEADFRGQLHEHSTYSDGSATIRQMADAARARGYEYLAITDHSQSLRIANGLSRDRLLTQLDEIADLNREFAGAFTLLSGIEADILADGSLDCDEDLLARLDVVVGSVHIRHRENEEQMTRRIVRALSNPYLTILGHPTGRLLGRREPYAVDMEAVIEAARANGKVLEINSAPERMDLNDTYARQAKDAGVKLTINADAHSTAALGLLPWGLCMARRAGLEAPDVINTYPLAQLRADVLRQK